MKISRGRAAKIFLLILFISILFVANALVKGPVFLSKVDRERIIEVSIEITYELYEDFLNPVRGPEREVIFVAKNVDDRVYTIREREIRLCDPMTLEEIKKIKGRSGNRILLFQRQHQERAPLVCSC